MVRARFGEAIGIASGCSLAVLLITATVLLGPSTPLVGSLTEVGPAPGLPCGQGVACPVVSLLLNFSSPRSIEAARLLILVTGSFLPLPYYGPGNYTATLEYQANYFPHWLVVFPDGGLWSGLTATMVNPSGGTIGGAAPGAAISPQALVSPVQITLTFPGGSYPSHSTVTVQESGGLGSASVVLR